MDSKKLKVLFAYRENLERHLSKANEKRIIIVIVICQKQIIQTL